jgi:hypothetical protein
MDSPPEQLAPWVVEQLKFRQIGIWGGRSRLDFRTVLLDCDGNARLFLGKFNIEQILNA